MGGKTQNFPSKRSNAPSKQIECLGVGPSRKRYATHGLTASRSPIHYHDKFTVV